jgi:naphthalene 1,2-dioxygenase system ferredoxin subunit
MSENWVDVGALDEVAFGDVSAVIVNDKEIAVYDIEGKLYATDNMCTHGAARLSDGFLEGHEIECPFHQGRFNVCTGEAMCAPLTQNIRVYSVKTQNDRVMINVD